MILWHSPREITQKVKMQEFWFLRSARRLMLIDIYMKFPEDSLKGFQVREWKRVWQTDSQTTGGKNNMSPNPKGGTHNKVKTLIQNININNSERY